MNLSDYDFIDFGASKGGSIRFALENLGGIRGFGIDINPDKVATMRKEGYECIEGDCTKLDLPANSVRFVIMSHLLEHLPNLETVEKVIASAKPLVTDFLYIQGPYFDWDEYLESLGLKFYWSDWRGHPYHLQLTDLEKTLRKLGLDDFTTLASDEILDSSDSSIHPIESPSDQHAYDPEKHPPKPYIVFDRPLWREIICIARVRPLNNMKQLLDARARSLPLCEAIEHWYANRQQIVKKSNA